MAGKHNLARLLTGLAWIFSAGQHAAAQEIRNGLSYRDVPATGYIRFNYENDMFFGTDRYFTQGVHVELVNRAFSASFIPLLFPRPENGHTRAGIGLESAGYSPSSITADSILYGDHPFAGLAYAKLFSISVDTARRRRVSGTLSLGWMGPSAGGYEIQAAIHRAVGSAEPAGWKYQLKDQPVVNYELNFEQGIGVGPRWLRLSAWEMARAGTLSNRIALGGIAEATLRLSARTEVSLYLHPALNLVAYESVLQGGPFTRNNPYRIAAADIRRIVGQLYGGLVLHFGSGQLGFYTRWQTPTFRGAATHMLGGLTFAAPL